jgi:hypothetical protein
VGNDVGGRVFFKQPARKPTTPAFRICSPWRPLKYQKLHKRALIREIFPRRSPLTSAQPDHNFADPDILPGFQFNVARLTVTLVQKAKDGDALCHWRAQNRPFGLRNRRCALLGLACNFGRSLFFVFGITRSNSQ